MLQPIPEQPKYSKNFPSNSPSNYAVCMSNWNRMKNDRKDNECLNWNGKVQENRGRLGWVESHLMAATWRVGSAFGRDCGSYFFAFFAVSFWREMKRLWLLQISFVPLWVLIFNVGTSNLNCKKKKWQKHANVNSHRTNVSDGPGDSNYIRSFVPKWWDSSF